MGSFDVQLEAEMRVYLDEKMAFVFDFRYFLSLTFDIVQNFKMKAQNTKPF